MDLKSFKVNELPNEAFLIPNYVEEEYEELILDRIARTPSTRWTQLSNRRLQNWGGVPHPKVNTIKVHLCMYKWL